MPHTVWEAYELYCDIIERTIIDISPNSIKRITASKANSLVNSMHRSHSINSVRKASSVAAPVDATSILDKLADVLDGLRLYNQKVTDPRTPSNGSRVPSDSLHKYLKSRSVPAVNVHAQILSNHFVTVKQLEAGVLSRSELLDVGIPLGVLVCWCVCV